MSILHAMAVLLALFSNVPRTSCAEAVRLGWQTPWATQGQLVMTLKNTNITGLLGLNLRFVGFSYGAPLNQAALGGEVDVLLTADQPALVLMSRSSDFMIVGRMMYNRVCLYVPPESEIRSLADLDGKMIMGPVGAAAERVALKALADAGLSTGSFRAGSIGMEQQTSLVGRSKVKWSGVDALYGFDPLPAIFEAKGQARMIACDKVVSLILASRSLVETRQEDLRNFIAAFWIGWFYFARNPELVDKWFAEEARLDVDSDILRKVASVEPNRFIDSVRQVRLSLNDEDYRALSEAQEFLLTRNVVKPVDIRDRVKLEALEAVAESYHLEELGARVRSIRGAVE